MQKERRNLLYGQFFAQKEDSYKAIWPTCSEKVSQGGNNMKHYNMANLCKHLQGHSGEYKKILETKATKREETEANSQASEQSKLLYKIQLKRRSFPPDDSCAKELTYHLVEMIAIDLQPFSSVVEDTGFCRLMANFEARYSLPS